MKHINDWEILTPDGWQDFEGIIQFEKIVKEITFQSGKILKASLSHRLLLKNNEFIMVKNLMIGDTLIGENGTEIVSNISEEYNIQKVYDLVEVKSSKHQYFTNGLISHNCDEMAFIPPRIQDEFMASVAPALSATKGKMIITSTPNGSKDIFAKIWFGTGKEWSKKDRDYLDKNTPKNDFKSLFIPYWLDDEKNTEEWIQREKRTLDDEQKWKIEFECLDGATKIDVYDKITNEYTKKTIHQIYLQLIEDALDDNLIITDDDL